MRVRVNLSLAALVVVTLVAAPAAPAAAAALTAKQIIDKALAHSYLGPQGTNAKVKMTLTSKRGSTRERLLLVWSRKAAGRVRSLVRITAPPDVAGTGFLFKENAGADDMWLYIPALKRARRIVGKARQGRFLGSDFTYADLEARNLKDATYKRLPDGRIGRYPCYVIEATPKASAGSPYSRIRTWIRQDNFVSIRLKMFNKAGALWKKLFVRRLGYNAKRQPVIKETRMVNVLAGSSTVLRVLSSQSLAGGGRGLFTVRNLSRGL